MLPRIKSVKPMDNYRLLVVFEDGVTVMYDVGEDIDSIPSYRDLQTIHGLFQQVQIDQSKTCIYWNENIDLPSDTIREYGRPI